jgi:hypothetical protein
MSMAAVRTLGSAVAWGSFLDQEADLPFDIPLRNLKALASTVKWKTKSAGKR